MAAAMRGHVQSAQTLGIFLTLIAERSALGGLGRFNDPLMAKGA